MSLYVDGLEIPIKINSLRITNKKQHATATKSLLYCTTTLVILRFRVSPYLNRMYLYKNQLIEYPDSKVGCLYDYVALSKS